MTRTPFGDWLEARIVEKDWTLRQAAEELGVQQSSLSRYISAGVAPSRDNLRSIAKALGADRAQLEALVDAGRPNGSRAKRGSLDNSLSRGIQGAGGIVEALADPRLGVAFWDLLVAWPDMTAEEQEDTLATFAHRREQMERRRGDAGGDPAGGGPA